MKHFGINSFGGMIPTGQIQLFLGLMDQVIGKTGVKLNTLPVPASEATALFNILVGLWHNDDPNRKDTDGDGIPDYKDIDQNAGANDSDGDGIIDQYDNDKAHKVTLDQVLKDLFPADDGAAFLAKIEE